MPSTFEPLLKLESFVTNDESTNVVTSSFITGSLMVVAMILTGLFIWSYWKDRYLFISVIAFVAFLYCGEMMLLSAINKASLDITQFRLFMGSSILFSIMFFIIAVFGAVKYWRRNSSSSPYVPTTVQNYLN